MKKSISRNHKNQNVMWKLRMLRKEPVLLVVIIVILASLTLFVVFPLFKMVSFSLVDDEGRFSLDIIAKILRNDSYKRIFMNSIKLGLISATIATVVGYIFAYTITRTEAPCKKFLRFMATLPIISPPFVLSLSIIFLFGRKGIITNSLLGITDFNVYGLHSLILVQSLSFFPVAYLTLSGILQAIDPSVEDAALNLGASRFKIFRTVTLPLSLPGIISGLLLVFIQSLQDFSNPAVIGGGYPTLGVEAYRVITGMYELKTGAVLAVMLLAPSLLAFLLQKYWISGKTYITVTGKPSQIRSKISEKHIVYPLFAICLLFCSIIVLFYGTVIWGAFVKVWGIDSSFSLVHFKYILSTGLRPLKNAVILAIIATPIAGILGMVIAYLLVRKSFIGKRYMSLASLLTFALPGTVVGIGYVLAFNDRPFLFTGSAFILICVFVFRNMPVGIEGGTSALMQIDPSIEEASSDLGANSFQTFKNITLPLIKGAFFSGLVYSFVRAMTAVSAIIFLVSAKWNVVTTRIFSLFEVSKYSDAAAYIVMMVVVIVVAIGIINALVYRVDKLKTK